MSHQDNLNFKSGFAGHDSMRNKAMKEFAPEMRGLSLSTPESNSSKARTNMPLYKKGGKVHGLTKMQTDLYIPTRSKQHHQKQTRFEKVEHKAFGGMFGTPDSSNNIAQELSRRLADSKPVGVKRGGKVHHKAFGGMFGTPDQSRAVQELNQRLAGAGANPVGVKRGGKVHHKHRRAHKADGGMMDGQDMAARVRQAKEQMGVGIKPFGIKRGGKVHHRVHKADGGMMGLNEMGNRDLMAGRSALGLKRGGKAHDDGRLMLRGEPLEKGFHGHGLKHGGKARHRSEGGPMRGEHPGMGSQNNYESDMRGEHAEHGAMRRGGKVHHKSEGGPMRGEHPTRHMTSNNYESNMRGEHGHHATMNRGGKMHRSEGGKCYAEGGYAAGGVGKIRHGQMTMSGKQISHRDKFKHG